MALVLLVFAALVGVALALKSGSEDASVPQTPSVAVAPSTEEEPAASAEDQVQDTTLLDAPESCGPAEGPNGSTLSVSKRSKEGECSVAVRSIEAFVTSNGNGSEPPDTTEVTIDGSRLSCSYSGRSPQFSCAGIDDPAYYSADAADAAKADPDDSTASVPPSQSASRSWPAWTVQIASFPNRSDAEETAAKARSNGLPNVGILESDGHSSLRSGFWVVYSGVYSESAASNRVERARSAGFPDALARYISAD